MNNAWLGGESQNVGSNQRQTRWLTPPHIVGALGTFDLDPCGAPHHYLAIRTYVPENGDDGLRDLWTGRIWLNPPYGKEAEPFLEKMVQHNHGTALIFARTETKSFHKNVWESATAVLFLSGRISFLDSRGVKAKANSGAPSCLVAYGAEDSRKLATSSLEGKYINLRHQYRIAA